MRWQTPELAAAPTSPGSRSLTTLSPLQGGEGLIGFVEKEKKMAKRPSDIHPETGMRLPPVDRDAMDPKFH